MKYYKFRDDKYESRGPYRLQPLATNSMDERPNLRFPIPFHGEEIWPEKQWQWSKERVLSALANDELSIEKRRGRWSVNYKQYLRSEDGSERGSKLYSIIEGIFTQSGTGEIKAIFGDGKAFDFPKPSHLIQKLISLCSDRDSIILDSFGGSGSTGHAVITLNEADNGKRKFILVEMEKSVANDITAKRLKAVAKSQDDGFRFCTLGEPLFDADGNVNPSVAFPDLAAHVFFCETGSPIPKRADGSSPLIGTFQGRAIYLLYSAHSIGVPSHDAGNVLTATILDSLPTPMPEFSGPRVVYAEGCTLPDDRLQSRGVTFKQVPYQIEGL